MTSSVSELIYNKFLENLSKNKEIKPETLEAIKQLYKNGKIANKTELSKLVQSMEGRHVQNQASDSQ
jgi:hypothetical protein